MLVVKRMLRPYNFAKLFAERDLFIRRQVLIPKDQDQMFEKRLLDGRKRRIVEICHIHANYFRAENI